MAIIPTASSLHVTKMAFTDLVVATLGANNLTAQVKQNATNFLKAAVPSARQLKNFSSLTANFNSADFLLGQVQNPVVQLYLNPKTIEVKKNVLLDKKPTRGGFVVQFWGHDLEIITVTAATAYFQVSKQPLAAFELLKRQCYQSRFNDAQPFLGNPILSMLYESQVLNGYFNDFSYSLSADVPYQFTYSFTFTVTKNVTSVLSSNIATTAANLINMNKLGNINKTNISAIAASPVQYGSGWGVQLF